MNDNDRYKKSALWYMSLSVVVMTMIALMTRMQGLNPPSLFIDDLWQGLLSGASLPDQFRLRSSAPIAFTALLGTALRLIPDPELSLQLVPFLAGLALIPLMAWVVYRLTKNPPAAVLAAAMITFAPQVAELSIRVKQYALDALLVAVLLLLAIIVCEEKKYFTLLVVAALTSLLFSFSSAVVSVLLISAFAVSHWRGLLKKAKNRWILVNLAVFFICTGLYYGFVLSGQKNLGLEVFWRGCFPDSFQGFFSGLTALFKALVPKPENLSSQWVEPFRQALSFVYIGLAAFGALMIVRKPAYRWLGICLVCLYPVLCMMAFLHLYPLGGGRTDLFTYPVTILLISSGLAGLFESLKRKIWRMDRMLIVCAVFVLPFCIPSILGPKIYYRTGGKLPEMVSSAQAAMRPDDGLIVYPHCAFCFAYYSNWPVFLEPCDYYAAGFNPVIKQGNVHVLPGEIGYTDHPEILVPELQAIIDRGYPGLVFFTMAVPASDHFNRYVNNHLKSCGYFPIGKIQDRAIAAIIIYRADMDGPSREPENE